MDRSTEATLSTYNAWIQLSRVQKICSLPELKGKMSHITFDGSGGSCAIGLTPNACHVTLEAVGNSA